MRVIGLTGGIASGKSTAASFLKELGAHVIDADQIAREIVHPGCPAWLDIIKEFGEDILGPDRQINREKLGGIIFQKTEARKKLNQITHPRIFSEIERQIEELNRTDPEKIVVIDVPLLIETGMTKMVDEVWLIFLPEKDQIVRLMERDGCTKEAAEKRIQSQMSLDEKRKFADRIIDTTGLLKDTRRQVNFYWNKFIKHESELGT